MGRGKIRETRKKINPWLLKSVRYLYVNNGFPKRNQTVYEIYWSKSQVAARQHSNMVTVQKALLELWHINEENVPFVNLSHPLTYVDRYYHLIVQLPSTYFWIIM